MKSFMDERRRVVKKWASNPSGHAVFVVDPVVTDRGVFSEVSFFFWADHGRHRLMLIVVFGHPRKRLHEQ